MNRCLLYWKKCQFGGIRYYHSGVGVFGDKKLMNIQLENLIQDLRRNDSLNSSREQCSLSRFVNAYRSYGHRIAQLKYKHI